LNELGYVSSIFVNRFEVSMEKGRRRRSSCPIVLSKGANHTKDLLHDSLFKQSSSKHLNGSVLMEDYPSIRWSFGELVDFCYSHNYFFSLR
jgi:hypothetical protein